MAKLLMIFGLPGSGKSTLSRHVQQLLIADGVASTHVDDKLYLEAGVLWDVERFTHDRSRIGSDGSIEGEHSVLLNPDSPPGARRIRLKSGHALNQAHRGMFSDLELFQRNAPDNRVVIAEVAYGANVSYPDEPLTHTGTVLFEWMAEQKIFEGDVLVYEVRSTMDERSARNSIRVGHIPTGEFLAYFAEAGHPIAHDTDRLADGYQVIENTAIDESTFLNHVATAYERYIRPWIFDGKER